MPIASYLSVSSSHPSYWHKRTFTSRCVEPTRQMLGALDDCLSRIVIFRRNTGKSLFVHLGQELIRKECRIIELLDYRSNPKSYPRITCPAHCPYWIILLLPVIRSTTDTDTCQSYQTWRQATSDDYLQYPFRTFHPYHYIGSDILSYTSTIIHTFDSSHPSIDLLGTYPNSPQSLRDRSCGLVESRWIGL